MNRQKQILAIVLLLLALSVSWAYVNWPRQKSVAVLKYAAGQQPVPAVVPSEKQGRADDGRILNLSELDRERPPFKGYRRNIFRPLWFDEMAGLKQKAAAVRPIVMPPPPPPIVPAMVPRREMTRFTFIGFLKTDSRKTVFLGKDKEILLVRAGETFAGRFKAVQITDKVLTIKVLDTNEEIIVPLIENRPLGSAR
jgi:hypothetical protein